MQYISTRNTTKTFSFKDVFLNGLASDGGLYVPKQIPSYSTQDLEKLKNLSYRDLAVKIILDFCADEFSESEIKGLIKKSYKNFRVQDVVKINKIGNINLLELFHGPTLAFKDIAMQVIGNMYENILEKNKLKVNVVVATSGDTGAAAIAAIKNRKNMKVFVLHPENKISEVQRKFMTTVDVSNVFNIGITGNFDDCQKLVKLMFANKDYKNSINMSGVNSINWARIVFQIVYYFFSHFKIAKLDEKINFSVPTGNFGDIYAGYVAKKMGLPINKLVIATNKNDILKRVVNTGYYRPLKVEHTVSPSMDIQVASNFERLIFDINSCSSKKTLKLMNDLEERGEFKIGKEELKKIKDNFFSESLSEEETKSIISEVYKNYGILVDPHTAVGIGVTKKISLEENTIVLATAHPSKFSEVVMEATGIKSELPENLKNTLIRKEKYDKLPTDLEKVKKYILKRI
ncbi:MAG TPA: threonine synthase [Pelagibacteraceae bacterium]|jgi:threonine synthase|nr:threonine synthase [Pelagibacteraceae bacterium]|tara:strand:+ start:1805 stop:3184 length:1380 start_codon:yes stop_codon:yes gene_type:complete